MCWRSREPGATFLLNSPYGPDEIWDAPAREVQEQIIDKRLRFFVVDGYAVAKEAGLGTRINTVMQTCFFALAGVLPIDEAVAAIKDAIVTTYGKRGEAVVHANFAAVDARARRAARGARAVDGRPPTTIERPTVPAEAPEFVQRVTADHARGSGRSPAGQRPPGRRDLPDRHGALGETNDRARDPDLGPDDLHRLRQVRARVPARRDPDEGLRPRRSDGRRPRRSVDHRSGRTASSRALD